MEFAWTEEQKAYRAELQALIRDNLPKDWWEKYANDSPSDPELMKFAQIGRAHV